MDVALSSTLSVIVVIADNYCSPPDIENNWTTITRKSGAAVLYRVYRIGLLNDFLWQIHAISYLQSKLSRLLLLLQLFQGCGDDDDDGVAG